jgi:hypothetical protein
MMEHCRFFAIVFCLSAGPAFGQSFNIAIGPSTSRPATSYGAAGLPGVWNAIPAAHNTTTSNLRQIDGTVSVMSVNQIGGTDLVSFDDPLTAGDDAKLMDHCLVTFTSNLETCLFFNDLENGNYEVICYAMMPGSPAVSSYTNSEEESGNPHYTVGGAWPGQHQELVTYSRHYCRVGPPGNDGLLRLHSGIAPGEDPMLGAACNGVQLRKLPPLAPADMNCDGAVNGRDVDHFVTALVDDDAYRDANPTCNIMHADLSGNGDVGVEDVAGFVNAALSSS